MLSVPDSSTNRRSAGSPSRAITVPAGTSMTSWLDATQSSCWASSSPKRNNSRRCDGGRRRTGAVIAGPDADEPEPRRSDEYACGPLETVRRPERATVDSRMLRCTRRASIGRRLRFPRTASPERAASQGRRGSASSGRRAPSEAALRRAVTVRGRRLHRATAERNDGPVVLVGGCSMRDTLTDMCTTGQGPRPGTDLPGGHRRDSVAWYAAFRRDRPRRPGRPNGGVPRALLLPRTSTHPR